MTSFLKRDIGFDVQFYETLFISERRKGDLLKVL